MDETQLGQTAQAVDDVKSWLRSYRIDASNFEDLIKQQIDEHRASNPEGEKLANSETAKFQALLNLMVKSSCQFDMQNELNNIIEKNTLELEVGNKKQFPTHVIDPANTFSKDAQSHFNQITSLCQLHNIEIKKEYESLLEHKVKEIFYENCYLQERLTEEQEKAMEGGAQAHMTAPILKSKVVLKDLLKDMCEEQLKERMIKMANCSQSSVSANLEQMEKQQQMKLSGINVMDSEAMTQLITDIEPLAQLKVEYQKQVDRMKSMVDMQYAGLPWDLEEAKAKLTELQEQLASRKSAPSVQKEQVD